MIVLHSSDTAEIELKGSRSEFCLLAGLLKAGEGGVELEVVDDPRPYELALRRIAVKRTAQPLVSVRVANDFTLCPRRP